MGDKTLSRTRAGAAIAGSAAILSAGIAVHIAHAPALDMVNIEILGRDQKPWPLLADQSSALTTALYWDFAVIVCYGVAGLLATTVATWVFWSPRAASLARLGQGAVLVVVGTDVLENVCLLTALGRGPADARSEATLLLLDAAAAASTIKWACLVPVVVVSLTGLLVAGNRLRYRHRPPKDLLDDDVLRLPVEVEQAAPQPQDPRPVKQGDSTVGAGVKGLAQAKPREGSDQARWSRAYAVPGLEGEDLTDERAAFCLSGGGIRSASLAMGVLETMRDDLLTAQYLISVSGGGYTAGAFAQILTAAGHINGVGDSGRPVHDPRTAYVAGSVEFDHVRRNASYLASNGAQMLVALGVLARGLIASLALIFSPAIVLGVAAAWLYHAIPVVVLPMSPASSMVVRDPAKVSVAAVLGVALAVWLVQVWSYAGLSKLRQNLFRWASRASVFATRIAVVVTVAVVGVPVLVWASGEVLNTLGTGQSVKVGGSLGTVVLTFLASLASLLWRKRKTIQDTVASGGSVGSRTAAVPNGLLQQLLVILSVAVLVVSWLMLFGVSAMGAAAAVGPSGEIGPTLLQAGVITVVVIFLGAVLDESSLSLHPFYRRRLATAFATRAVIPKTDAKAGTERRDAGLVAVPYGSHERTSLSTYGRSADGVVFPEIVFAAAANLTGENKTPPGLTAVSFTMSAEWVGGPDVGWVRTAYLEKVSPSRLRRDVTVQAAVAISGAAIASAMGRFARWYQIVLTVSGARLGAWLPNPVFLHKMRESEATRNGDIRARWTLPGLPRVRRVTYLLRELFDLHPSDERLLLVTDGGHYENLGLVEALRRRCQTIYCVDGGGDSPPAAPGLAQAIALARAELGVTITLDNAFTAEPGSGKPLDPSVPWAGLNAALSHEPVITGTITYPVASGLLEPDNTGRLYVARALLWPEMPYELLSYAAQNPTFPHDSTGDQWFDDGGFGAYTQLGRELGTQVLQIRQAERSRHPTGALSANETALPPQEVSDDNRATGGRRRGGLERRRCWRGFGHRRSRPDS